MRRARRSRNTFSPTEVFIFADLELNYKQYLPQRRDAAILDVGCGRGRILAYLKATGFTNTTGIDQDAGAIEWTRRNVTPNVNLVSDLKSFLRDRRGSFDLLIVKDMLYYLPKAEVVDHLALMREALKPDGRMIVEVFNGAALTGHFIGLKDYRIEWIPTEFSIKSMLTDAGLHVVSIFALTPPRKGLKRRIFNLIASCWRAALKAIYFFERGRDEQNPRILTTKFVTIAERTPK